METDPLKKTLHGLAFGAAAALVGGLAWWMMAPGGGPGEFERARLALQQATSWRMHYAGGMAGEVVMEGEVACPRVHMVRRLIRGNGMEQPEYQEFIVLEEASYRRTEPEGVWQQVESAWELENLCAQIQRGAEIPLYMPPLHSLVIAGGIRIEKGERKTAGGADCRVWHAKRPLKIDEDRNEKICIGVDDHLPRERVTSRGRFTYSAWNEPLEIAPPERVQRKDDPWQ
jgi:hypothetical protein